MSIKCLNHCPFLVPVCPFEKGFVLTEDDRCVCPEERGFYVDENGNCQRCPVEVGFVLTKDGRCICDPEKGYILTRDGICDCPVTHVRSDDGTCVGKYLHLIEADSSASASKSNLIKCIFASFAHSSILLPIPLCRSLLYIKYCNGPRMDPTHQLISGMPQVIIIFKYINDANRGLSSDVNKFVDHRYKMNQVRFLQADLDGMKRQMANTGKCSSILRNVKYLPQVEETHTVSTQ